MRVSAQFFAQLCDITQSSELVVDLADGATVITLLESLYERFPALRSHDKSILVGIGVDFVNRDHVLKDGDTIAVMPPVQGG